MKIEGGRRREGKEKKDRLLPFFLFFLFRLERGSVSGRK